MRELTAAPPPSTDSLLAAQGHGLGPKGGGIAVAIFDVDGVLTDGRLWFDAQGEQLKAFHVQDGHGLKLLARHGIEPVVISGRDSAALRVRLKELGIARVHLGVADKLVTAQALLREADWRWEQVAVIGDDWPDLPLMARAAFACAPADAHPDARHAAHHVTQRGGGQGAAREFCDLLLRAAGGYAQAHALALQHGRT